jgi:hypothetical protein
LIPLIERRLTITVGGLTGYTPVEMILREPRPHIFEDNFSKSSDNNLNNLKRGDINKLAKLQGA